MYNEFIKFGFVVYVIVLERSELLNIILFVCIIYIFTFIIFVYL